MLDLNRISKKLKLVPIHELKPYMDNPRRNNKSSKIVAKSIEEYGYINPIIVDENNMVLAGHTRLKALKHLQSTGKLAALDEVEVLEVSGLSDEQKHGFVIADNRVGEFSQWNYAAVDRLASSVNKDSELLKEIGIRSFTDTKKDLEAYING